MSDGRMCLSAEQIRTLAEGGSVQVDIPPDVLVMRVAHRGAPASTLKLVVTSIAIAVVAVLLQVVANLTTSVNVRTQWDLPFCALWWSVWTSVFWLWLLRVHRR